MSPGKVILTVLGALAALVGVAMTVAGAVLLWAYGTQRDPDGFFESPTYELASDGYAVATERLDLGAEPGDWFPTPGSLVFRIEATPTDPEHELFVGIADAEDVDAYLDGVGHAFISRLGPRSSDIRFRTEPGSAVPADPSGLDIWVASDEGPGTRTLSWDAEAGDWRLVLMNADAAVGVLATATAAAKVDLLPAIAFGILGFGLFSLIAAGILLLLGLRRGAVGVPAETAVAATSATAGTYPIVVEGRLDPDLSRGMWLVKWFLAIPHLVIMAFLWAAFALLTVVAGFSILFTGRYPRGIFDFNVGVLRWSWRVSYYAFGVIGTDRYPPFSLEPDPTYPATLDVAYPGELSRGLVLVKWWLLAIPHYLIVGVLTGGLIAWTFDATRDGGPATIIGGGVIGVLVLVAGVMLLFTGRYPTGLYDLVMGLQRWVYRVTAYATLMTDEYPPFRLDSGGTEPPAGPPAPPRTPDGGGGTERELANA